jgi:hypothetical protein
MPEVSRSTGTPTGLTGERCCGEENGAILTLLKQDSLFYDELTTSWRYAGLRGSAGPAGGTNNQVNARPCNPADLRQRERT